MRYPRSPRTRYVKSNAVFYSRCFRTLNALFCFLKVMLGERVIAQKRSLISGIKGDKRDMSRDLFIEMTRVNV